MRVLYIGDVFAAPGLRVVARYLERFGARYDLIVANGENTAGGFGITRKAFEELRAAGVDVVTLGNHAFDQNETADLLESTSRLIRPATYPPGTPGLGHVKVQARDGSRVTVGQVMGRVYMDAGDDPFAAADAIVDAAGPDEAVIVEMHAEATSEKKVMAFHLQGRATAVIGSHTHVQTADAVVVDGTASITDVGMSGVQHSSIGMQFDEVYARFLTRRPRRFRPATGEGTLCAVVIEAEGRRARSITRIQWREGMADPAAASDGAAHDVVATDAPGAPGGAGP